MAAEEDLEDMEALRRYRRDHPQVQIADPEDTYSGLWEVSLPGRACMAFDTLPQMLRALWTTTFHTDDSNT